MWRQFVRGITFKPGDVVPVGSPGSVACMRTKNVQSERPLGRVGDPRVLRQARGSVSGLTGDLLVSSANSSHLVGKCCRVPQLQWPATFGGSFRFSEAIGSQIEARTSIIGSRRLASKRLFEALGEQTTNISNLNVDRCLRLGLPLPSLPEQRRIAEILDKADALRAKRRAALAQLDTFTQSIFLDMFGDPATAKGFERIPPSTLYAERVTDGEHLTPKQDRRHQLLLSASSSEMAKAFRERRFLVLQNMSAWSAASFAGVTG